MSSRSRSFLAALSLLLLPAISGCAKASPEGCSQLADKLTELALADLDAGEAGKNKAESLRPTLEKKCLDDPPSEKQVECILAATHEDQIPEC